MTIFSAFKLQERYQHLMLHARNLGFSYDAWLDLGLHANIDSGITEEGLNILLSEINKEVL